MTGTVSAAFTARMYSGAGDAANSNLRTLILRGRSSKIGDNIIMCPDCVPCPNCKLVYQTADQFLSTEELVKSRIRELETTCERLQHELDAALAGKPACTEDL